VGLSKDPRKRQRSLANLKKGQRAGRPNGRTHGGYSRVARARLEAKQLEVYDALSEDVPVRGPDGGVPAPDSPLLRLLAQTLCRLEDVEQWIALYGAFDPKTKEARRVLDVEATLRKEAADYLDRLGMSPRSRARLGVDFARQADLAQAMSEPDPEKRAHLLRQAGLPDIDGNAEEEGI
jgi:hypothetical protein